MRAASLAAALATTALALAACGSRATSYQPTPHEPAPAETYTTATRAPASPGEQQLAARDVVFDPALDCVARALALGPVDHPDPAVYRNKLPLRCGSPLYVLRAQAVGDDAAFVAAVEAFEREMPSSAQLALGIADAGSTSAPQRRFVVFARRLVELDAVSRAGAARLAGRLLVPADQGRLLISTARGLTAKTFAIRDGRFSVETGAPRDATLELVYLSGRTSEPFARLELGAGSPLFHRDGSLMSRIGEARRAIAATPLVRRDGLGTCDSIPPQLDGIDITDRARCFEVPLLDVDELADEVAYRPLLQDVLVTPAASLIEIAAKPDPTPRLGVRVLMRFEALAPDAARARVLEILRRRWPDLVERSLPKLAGIVETWSHDPDVFGSSATYKPALDGLAGAWTTTTRYYDALTTSRDLDTALALLQPDTTPTAVDVAVVQVRGKAGAMLHVIAVVLEMP